MRGGMRSISGGSRRIRGGWDSPTWPKSGIQKPPRRKGFKTGLRKGSDAKRKK